MTANEKREAVAAKYRTILGRNLYSQAKRDYCFKKYSDGKYYSDCSSSVCYTYKECGMSFGILNTVGMYQSSKLTAVPVKIVKGQIQDPEKLRVGDMLLYAGSDSSRAYAGYVGHVEMVGEISGNKVTLYGHGSGNPKKTEMTAKNKSRYNSKTSTKLGHKGLIKVVRFIQDDTPEENVPENIAGMKVKVKPEKWNIRRGPTTDFDIITTVQGGTILEVVTQAGWYYVKTGNVSGWISDKAVERV